MINNTITLLIISIILNFVIINSVIPFKSLNSIYKYNRYRYRSIARNDNDYDDTRIQLNYPILQVYINSELKTELFCNDDMDMLIRKVKSYLTQLDCEIDSNSSPLQFKCDNIYS